MAESMSNAEESLECPVCYKIPRELPISCCEAGHIICQSCRERVANCPTCRGSLDSNITSSLAGKLIMIVKHKCKFSFYGCETKMKLDEILVHEETCPERTVTCLGFGCDNEVQMRKFNEHVTEEACALPIHPNLIDNDDGSLFFDINQNNINSMRSFHLDNLKFYFLSTHWAPMKCFYLLCDASR